ncbi:MAG: TonB-dependent receptor [Chitinophagaceae bacterium]
MKKKYVLSVLLFFLCAAAWAQGTGSGSELRVSGKVLDKSSGQPLPAVTVSIKNTNLATVTDASGSFSINVRQTGATLVFSYAGMLPQEFVVTRAGDPITIYLTDKGTNMDEVVVVGYGTQKKSVTTGAISSVKAADLENMPIARIEQALQGRTSGLTIAASSGQPGSSSTVRIRGTTSINGGASDPLYVIDGMIVDVGGIDFLNQNDIESVEVLKDAASAAIYGARASAGVILITTKKGKGGNVQLNYNGYYGTQAPARRLDLLNATQYATLRNEASVAGGGNIIYNDPQSLGKGTDWQDLIFNNDARMQNHELSVSGGGDKSTYYASFGYYAQDGIVATDISKYKRFNIRLNSSHKIKKWLSFGNNVAYSHIKSQGLGNTNGEFGGPLASAINLDPITPAVITDPSVANQPPYSTKQVVRDANGNPYGISTTVEQEMTNPLAYIKAHEGNYGWSDNVVGNVYLEIEPIKGLKIRSNVGGKLAFWGSESFNPVVYLNATTSTTNNSFYREQNRGINWLWENTASYTRSIGDHNITAMVGTGAYVENNTRATGVTYFNLPVNTFKEASMNYSTAQANKDAWGSEGVLHKVSSLYGRLTYDFQEKYLFQGIIRRDGSSRFGSNNKYGYFPSASVGWVMSREKFFPVSKTVSFLKLRGSYGVTGNDNIGDFQYVSTIGGGRNYTFGYDNYLIGYSPNGPANPDLKWEQTSQLNIGVDAILFRDFTVTLDWYKKKTTGILQVITIPAYVGTGNPSGNVADMENTGVELELGYNKRIGEVSFGVKGNISYLKNKVTYLGDGKEYLSGGATIQNGAYPLTRTQVGHAIGSFYGFKPLGIFQTQAEVDAYVNKSGGKIQPDAKPGDFKWADNNSSGGIDEADRQFIGDPTPNWSYGFTINASWKNFDLLIFGQGVAGNDIFNGLRRLDITTANWTTAALNRWTGAGTSNDFPRLTTDDKNGNFKNPSTFYLSSGAYFRIKTLQIGYTLPKSITGKAGLSRTRIYLSSGNLVTFTKYTGFDPEIGGGSYGIDRGIYPQARSFMVGLNLGL